MEMDSVQGCSFISGRHSMPKVARREHSAGLKVLALQTRRFLLDHGATDSLDLQGSVAEEEHHLQRKFEKTIRPVGLLLNV